MTQVRPVSHVATDLDAFAAAEGHVAVTVSPEGKLGPAARRLNRLTKGAVQRAVSSARWERMQPAEVLTIGWPTGLAAEALHLVRLDRSAKPDQARAAGVALGRAAGSARLLVEVAGLRQVGEFSLGLMLQGYSFTDHRGDKGDPLGEVTLQCADPDAAARAATTARAVAEGVFFTRDLVSEPANVLTTTEFADRLTALADLGLEIDVLEEDRLQELGMGALLAVGQGSAAPSRVVVMRWRGGGDEAPLALVGKGVVFDTGGISLKPAAGMEEMTMDMGGAGVVAGVMKTLALRKARANVVGLVGLVENMPSGTATRPGDVVTSMKGDTIEVVNTDAEGRLVLADVMWYAQERFRPSAMIDLATLTGACIIALGNSHAGVFASDDVLCANLLAAAGAEGEGAWRLPLGKAYDDQIKTPNADMKNSGGRPAGAATAAMFLKRFVKDDVPWAHIDIAGVALSKADHAHGPKGATGWGVLTLNRLIADRFEA